MSCEEELCAICNARVSSVSPDPRNSCVKCAKILLCVGPKCEMTGCPTPETKTEGLKSVYREKLVGIADGNDTSYL